MESLYVGLIYSAIGGEFEAIQFRHIYRQANWAANYIANIGHSRLNPICWEHNFPSTFWKIILEDCYGVSFSRCTL